MVKNWMAAQSSDMAMCSSGNNEPLMNIRDMGLVDNDQVRSEDMVNPHKVS